MLRFFTPVKRINPLIAAAKKLDLALNEEHDYVLEHDLRLFSYSGCDRVHPKLFFVFSGVRENLHLKMFDYNGSFIFFGIPRFIFQTIGFAQVDGKNLQHFLIAPKTFYWRISALFNRFVFLQEGVPEDFLKKYVILVNKGQVLPKFTKDFYIWFLSLGKTYTIETQGSRFIFYRRNKVISLRLMGEFYKDFRLAAEFLIQGLV